jgi:hypothetical protein
MVAVREYEHLDGVIGIARVSFLYGHGRFLGLLGAPRRRSITEVIGELQMATQEATTLLSSKQSDFENNSPFSFGASQLNTDFAEVASRELLGDIDLEDASEEFCDASVSPMVTKLLEQFAIDETRFGKGLALLKLVLRCYLAGRLSRERLN